MIRYCFWSIILLSVFVYQFNNFVLGYVVTIQLSNKLIFLPLNQCVHEGLKNHVCDLCGKRFGVVSSLLKHKRIQHEGQKHPCDLCDKSFCEAYHLKIHISADHEGQKNFKCEFCEKSFGRPKKLRIHIKNAHGKL